MAAARWRQFIAAVGYDESWCRGRTLGMHLRRRLPAVDNIANYCPRPSVRPSVCCMSCCHCWRNTTVEHSTNRHWRLCNCLSPCVERSGTKLPKRNSPWKKTSLYVIVWDRCSIFENILVSISCALGLKMPNPPPPKNRGFVISSKSVRGFWIHGGSNFALSDYFG